MFKKLPLYIILGLLLRLVLMPATAHPDLRGFNLAAYFIAQKGEVFTFYDHMRKLPPTDRLVEIYIHDGQGIFIYPPLAYLTHALFNLILYPLYPHDTWYKLMYYYDQFLVDPGRPWLVFLLKVPYLIADGFSLLILRKILDPRHRFIGSLIWIFNPVTLYSAYMVGQFDIFIAMFTLLAVYLSQKKSYLSPVALALAAGFKPFTLLFLPLLPGKKWLNVLLGFLTFLFIIAPYLPSQSFRRDALLASQSDKILYAKVLVTGSQYLSWFFVGLFLIYWFNLLKPTFFSTFAWLAAAFMPFYVFSDYHPQWFTWMAPILTLCAAVYTKSRLPILVMVACYFVIVLTFDSSLNFGLFGINFTFTAWLVRYFPPDEFASLVRSLFAATAVVFLLRIKKPATDGK